MNLRNGTEVDLDHLDRGRFRPFRPSINGPFFAWSQTWRLDKIIHDYSKDTHTTQDHYSKDDLPTLLTRTTWYGMTVTTLTSTTPCIN